MSDADIAQYYKNQLREWKYEATELRERLANRLVDLADATAKLKDARKTLEKYKHHSSDITDCLQRIGDE